jgi:acylphosphatase
MPQGARMAARRVIRDRDRHPSAAKHIVVHGRVQGVGFRESLRYEAEMRGLRGWVRNRREGTVEAVLAGDPTEVDEVVAWARRGPPSARVTTVEVHEIEGHFTSFERLPTA